MNKKIITIIVISLSKVILLNASDVKPAIEQLPACSFHARSIDFATQKKFSLKHIQGQNWQLLGNDNPEIIPIYEETENFIANQKAPFLLSCPLQIKKNEAGLGLISITEVNGKKLTIPSTDYKILRAKQFVKAHAFFVLNDKDICNIEQLEQNKMYTCQVDFNRILPGNTPMSVEIPLEISGAKLTEINNILKEEHPRLRLYDTYFIITDVMCVENKKSSDNAIINQLEGQKKDPDLVGFATSSNDIVPISIENNDRKRPEDESCAKQDLDTLQKKDKESDDTIVPWDKTKLVVLYTSLGVVGVFSLWTFLKMVLFT